MAMSLEEVAALAAQLSPKDKLALAALIVDDVSHGLPQPAGPEFPEVGEPEVVPPETLWDVLGKLAGTIDGPEDWSAEHDHYLYGTPKRSKQAKTERPE